MKGQLSVPESYYQPPPQPVYQCVPIPLAPPPNVAFMNYNISIAPLGLPSASWQEQSQPMIRGQAITVEPLGIQWGGGYGNAAVTVSAPGVTMNFASPTMEMTTTTTNYSTNYDGVRTTEQVTYSSNGYVDPYAANAAVAMTAGFGGTMEVRMTERYDDGTTVTTDVVYGDGIDAPLLS